MKINYKCAVLSFLTSVIIAVLIIAFFIAVTSCGGRKKAVERSSAQNTAITKTDSSALSTSKSEVKAEKQEFAKEIEKEKVIEYEGAVGDSLTVTEKDGEGNIISETIIKGSGKARFSERQKTADKSSSEINIEKKESENKVDLNKKATSQNKSTGLKRTLETKKAWFGFCFWLFLAFVILFCLNKRFNWLSRVTAWFHK